MPRTSLSEINRDKFWAKAKPEFENIKEVDPINSKRTVDSYWYEIKLKPSYWKKQNLFKAPFTIGLSISENGPAVEFYFNKYSKNANFQLREYVKSISESFGLNPEINDNNVKNRKTYYLRFKTATKLNENNFDIVKKELLNRLIAVLGIELFK